MTITRGKMKEIICACGCGKRRLVRIADVKRGWGKYFSKSCKAKDQERKTGQFESFNRRQNDVIDYEIGWDAHKDMW